MELLRACVLEVDWDSELPQLYLAEPFLDVRPARSPHARRTLPARAPLAHRTHCGAIAQVRCASAVL